MPRDHVPARQTAPRRGFLDREDKALMGSRITSAAATASISARSSTRGSSSGGKQMQSALAIIPRFVFSSLLSLVFKVISLLQSFQPLLKLSNLEV
jgi:hypothetical protein